MLAVVLLLFPVLFLSCVTGEKKDQYVLAFDLDSTQLGKSDSLQFEIYNGKVPGPGDSTRPVQVIRVKTPKDSRTVEIRLSEEVGKDFSMVVTGTDSDGGVRKRIFEFNNFVLMPADRTVRKVVAKDLRGLIGDTLEAQIEWEPADAANKSAALLSLDTTVIKVLGVRLATTRKVGTAEIEVTSVDGGFKDTFDVVVAIPAFKADILPITSLKCNPCHIPGQTFNFQDSVILIRKGAAVLDRIGRAADAPGRMPLNGSSNGDLSARQLAILVDWLQRNTVPVKGMIANDMKINFGDTSVPDLEWTPADASNRFVKLTSIDSNVVAVSEDARLVSRAQGTTTVLAESEEGGFKDQFKVTVAPPSFTRNVLPITAGKCSPCHAPGQTFNFQDSSMLILAGAQAIDRLGRDSLAAGKMPLRGSQNGDLTAHEKAILLAWLKVKIIPLKGIFVPPADSVLVNESKLPTLTYDPPDANNKSYILTSTDTSKIGIDGIRFFGKVVGQARVIIRTVEGNHIDSVTVKVKPIPVDSIVAHDTAAVIGDTTVPRIEFFPAKAANKAYTLSLLRPSTIVAIPAGGKSVVGLVLGKDTVLATSADGAKKSRLIFTVGPVKATGLSVRDTNGIIGQQVLPILHWTPDNTTNKASLLTVNPADSLIAGVVAGRLVGKSLGQARVTAKATADSTLKASFRFTVGPVALVGITATATFQHPGATLNARPFITFNPSNATNRAFKLSSGAATLVSTPTDTTVTTLKLGTAPITVTATDGAKKAVWNVTVIRTPFTGSIKNLTAAKCIACHSLDAFPTRNWQDSAQTVEFRKAIITRISATDATKMPPPGSPAMTSPEIKTLTDWLSVE